MHFPGPDRFQKRETGWQRKMEMNVLKIVKATMIADKT